MVSTPIQMPCHTMCPMRSDLPAPWYWATKALTYVATPRGKQSIAKWSMPAGNVADIAAVEYQQRNIRSTKFITVHEPVETISGMAN